MLSKIMAYNWDLLEFSSLDIAKFGYQFSWHLKKCTKKKITDKEVLYSTKLYHSAPIQVISISLGHEVSYV